jgi:small redox-active disulfide protein 2
MKLDIKILGTGCPKCKNLERITTEVVTENNVDSQISKVEDIMEIMQYGVLSTPGLVINDKVVISGRVPSKEEIKQQIEKFIHA